VTDQGDRVALVTGASRGIGRAIALALAGAGATVAVNFRRDEAAAATVVTEIEGAGGRAAAFGASVDDEAAVMRMVDAVHETFGPVSILVHNAGMASSGRDVSGTEPREVLRLFGVHALGPFRLTRLLLPDLRAAGRGDVVFIGSAGAAKNLVNTVSYNMAKAAIESFALSLAKEERGAGLRVNIVLPGLTATDMGTSLLSLIGKSGVSELDPLFPYGHVCRPEEVASVVAFVVSPGGSYLTGQRIFVDAGAEVDLLSALSQGGDANAHTDHR
jgi:NAD(P)-dependent dehydrogenase (short-subunit alcohol dehydrogenase family)